MIDIKNLISRTLLVALSLTPLLRAPVYAESFFAERDGLLPKDGTNRAESIDSFSAPSNVSSVQSPCKPALDAGSIDLATGQSYVICQSHSCQMSLSNLIMGNGSLLYLPPNCEDFDLRVQSARFEVGSTIYFQRLGVGERGGNLNVTIDRAELAFPMISLPDDPASAAGASIAAQLGLSNQVTVATSGIVSGQEPPQPSAYSWGLRIQTIAGPGAKGAAGANGITPGDASCSNMDGPGKPTRGQNGEKGKAGAPGGRLDVSINVTAASRDSVSEKDILLEANGGPGGNGGFGGMGGGPVAGVSCTVANIVVFSHGGHSKEPDGLAGPKGDRGKKGTVHRHIRIVQ